ncbi:MAG: asparaginase [Clostridiaceae bacterium]|nr:asparaginase [Clostridiaceae bacterium]
MSEKLVEIIRSGIVESVHYGDIAVVNKNGDLLYYAGNPEQAGFFRSSAKPLILLSHLIKNIHGQFNLTLRELAIMASSHSGGRSHIEVLSGIAKKLGVRESDLTCGVREPFGEKERYELYKTGKEPGQFHNNCSGKHLGNIAACKAAGLSWDSVHEPFHPVQLDVKALISDFCGLPEDFINVGVDGCGVPVFGVPMKNMALAYSHIFDTGFMNGKYAGVQELLHKAVTQNPDMIASDDRIDTQLIRLTRGDHFGKMGSDGVFCVHIHSKGIGVALKILDGSIRAVAPAVIETLVQLKTLSLDVTEKLKDFHYPPVKTWSGKVIGKITPVFKLKKVK